MKPKRKSRIDIKTQLLIFVAFLFLCGIYLGQQPKTKKQSVQSPETRGSDLNHKSGEFIHPENHHTDGKNKIAMRYQGFEPSTIIVEKGTTVIFRNDELRDRWPASNAHPAHGIYSGFDPGIPIKSAEQWTLVFGKVGEWKFHDDLIPNQYGTIKVVEVGEIPLETSVFQIEIREKKFVSAYSTLHVNEGEDVIINFTPDEEEEIYLQGYDKSVLLWPGKKSTISFTVNTPGKFTFEFKRSGIEIGSIVVQPK